MGESFAERIINHNEQSVHSLLASINASDKCGSVTKNQQTQFLKVDLDDNSPERGQSTQQKK